MNARAVRVDISGAVCTITLNRPDRLNAMNEQMCTELHESTGMLAEDPAIRVVVIAGEGRSFSAGADLRDGGVILPDDWAGRRRAAGRWQRLLDRLEALPQATVAVLHGHVVGGAVLLAAACDLRIAAQDVAIAVPEVAIGLPLTWGGIPRLVREIGLSRTRDLVMTGRTVGGEEAMAWGLVHRLVPPGQLGDAADSLVTDLVAMPEVPLALTCASLRALGRDLLTASWADADLLAWTLREPGTATAAQAYTQRHLGGPRTPPRQR